MIELNDPNLKQLLALSKDMLAISLAISGSCAVICGLIAARRKARVAYWSVMGFVFGPFALPFVLRAKPAGKNPMSEPGKE
jgi:hypothetical protein